jgi:hypothetical protein
MKTLLFFGPLLIKNPLEIYKYNKVILNDSMVNHGVFRHTKFFLYLKQIFKSYNIKYLKSFKYFIKICDNIDFQFKNIYNHTILGLISLILRYYIINYNKYNKNTKKTLIYLIKKFKSLEIYSINDYNILNYFNLAGKYYKIHYKIYKYILSLNIYYTKYNTYYETKISPPNQYIYTKINLELLIMKIKNKQEIWRSRRLFILLCIL